MMSVSAVLNQLKEAQLKFLRDIPDSFLKQKNIDCWERAKVISQLCSLSTDIMSHVQCEAVIALGKIAKHDTNIVQDIIKRDILSQLLKNIGDKNKSYKEAILIFLRVIAKHSSELALIIVNNNGLQAIVECLKDFDPTVKEAAVWALGYIAKYDQNLAQLTVDAGAMPLLVLCLKESRLYTRQIGASAINDVCKHNVELAQAVVDAGAISVLVKNLTYCDAKIKHKTLLALSAIAKHSADLANAVVDTKIIPDVLNYTVHENECVVSNATTLISEICKHTMELALLVTNSESCIGKLITLITPCSVAKLPAIKAVGYIAGYSDQQAMVIIDSKGIVHLEQILQQSIETDILETTVWAIGQIGKHTLEHANSVAVANILPQILKLYNDPRISKDFQATCKATLKQILQKCTYVKAFQAILNDAPTDILKYVLEQLSKILPNNVTGRKEFAESCGLRKLHEISTEPGSTLYQYIKSIKSYFPEEIIRLVMYSRGLKICQDEFRNAYSIEEFRYYTPGYHDSLLEAVEQYQPK